MAIVEDNSLEFALQETAEQKPDPVAASSTEQRSGSFTNWFRRKCHITIVRSCQRVHVERLGLYFSYLSSSKLSGRTDSRSKINGFDSRFSSQSFPWRCGCAEISIVILVSLFVCCFRFSGVFCVIPSIKSIQTAQIADIPWAGITNAI